MLNTLFVISWMYARLRHTYNIEIISRIRTVEPSGVLHVSFMSKNPLAFTGLAVEVFTFFLKSCFNYKIFHVYGTFKN